MSALPGMRRGFSRGLLPLLFALPALAAGPARAAGLLIPAGGGSPLAIQEHRVRVDINNGVAVTEVVQIFRNEGTVPLEAVYSFVLPRAASLSGFSMWIEGREVTGEVLERGRAREIYQQIVHPDVEEQAPPLFPRDPGLVEEVSYREYRVTIFPVPARGTQKVKVTYYQYLPLEAGRFTYLYPMETRAVEDSRARGHFSLDVDLRSAVGITGCDFPTRFEEQVVSDVFNAHRASAHLFRSDGDLDRDFVMTCGLGREKAGLDLITYRRPSEDGYFLLLATLPPGDDGPSEDPVDYTFIVDVSGSMRRGRKLSLAGEALARFLESASPSDRFNLVAFNVSPAALDSSPLPNDSVSRERLIDFLREVPAVGGTDLYPALELAYRLAAPGRKQAFIVISDGGLNDLDENQGRFLDLARRHDAAVFGLSLGNDANAPLLEALSEATGGFSAQISTQENLLERGARLRERMRGTPLRGLKLEADGSAGIREVAPASLADLYPGGQAALAGRFTGRGRASFRIRGTRNGSPVLLETEADLGAADTLNPEIRRLWAERRAADLLGGMRAGRLEERERRRVTDLGIAYSIVTPFTSFLVLESEEMFRRYGIERRTASLLDEESAARAESSRRADESASAVPGGDRPAKIHWDAGGGAGAAGPEFLALAGALWAARRLLRRAERHR